MPNLSPELLPGAIFALAICAVVGAAAWQYFAEQKRREALAAAALRLGLEYCAGDPGLGREPFSGFPIFCQGRNRRFSNVLRGRFDAAVLGHFELHPGWRVEGQGDWLAACRDGRRVAPEDLGAFLDEAKTTFYAFRNR
jgi:hypothetical protein